MDLYVEAGDGEIRGRSVPTGPARGDAAAPREMLKMQRGDVMNSLSTKRLTLRPVAQSDRAAVIAGVGDLAVSRWLSVVPHPYTDDHFDYFLAEIASSDNTFAVEDAAGFCGIMDTSNDVLGYWMAPAAQGRGYATEAARLALSARFALKEDPCSSGYFAGNRRSANVLTKLGFVETGRDEVHCRSLGQRLPHVSVTATKAAFMAALPIEARSARLTYRSLYPTDAAALHEVVRHWDVTRMLGPAWPWPADPAFTATCAKGYLGTGFVWGLFLNGGLIGTVGVTEGELGYCLHPKHHRQGFMREACETALTLAFGSMNLPNLRANIWADNGASLGLLRSLGFQIVGQNMGASFARPEPEPGFDLVLEADEWRGA